MKIIGPHHPIKKFSFDRKERLLTAYASDLGRRVFGQLFDDACDLGLVVDGKEKEIPFYVSGQDEDKEGDIAGWHLLPYRQKGKYATLRMLIIND